MKPLRVMHVISGLAVGGAERNLLNLVTDKSHPEIIHIIVCRRLSGGLYQDFVDAGIELIGLRQASYALYNPLRWREISEIAQLVQDKQIDILHAHCPPSLFFVPLAARKAKCRCVVSVHALRKQLSFFEYRQIFPVTRWVDRYVEGSAAVHEDLHRAGISARQLEYVPYGVDGALFASNTLEMRESFRKKYGISNDSIVACRIARFHSQKGFDTLLRMVPKIVASLPQFRLVLVGDGPEMPYLKQLVLELGIRDFVLFTGFFLQTEAVYAASDLVLITARTEALGISQLEALAAGKAIVSFDVGGLDEVLEHDVNALMVEPGDSAAFIDAVLDLAADKSKQQRFAQQSQKRFQQTYSVEAMRNGIIDTYRSICS